MSDRKYSPLDLIILMQVREFMQKDDVKARIEKAERPSFELYALSMHSDWLKTDGSHWNAEKREYHNGALDAHWRGWLAHATTQIASKFGSELEKGLREGKTKELKTAMDAINEIMKDVGGA
jgi:hypothetical protein